MFIGSPFEENAKGEEVIMRYMAPGEVFAAVALFPGGTYPVTAEATERTRVRTWTGEALHTLVREHPRFEANLLRIVSSHTQEALRHVRELATENVAQRLARTSSSWGPRSARASPAEPCSSTASPSRSWPKSRARRCLP